MCAQQERGEERGAGARREGGGGGGAGGGRAGPAPPPPPAEQALALVPVHVGDGDNVGRARAHLLARAAREKTDLVSGGTRGEAQDVALLPRRHEIDHADRGDDGKRGAAAVSRAPRDDAGDEGSIDRHRNRSESTPTPTHLARLEAVVERGRAAPHHCERALAVRRGAEDAERAGHQVEQGGLAGEHTQHAQYAQFRFCSMVTPARWRRDARATCARLSPRQAGGGGGSTAGRPRVGRLTWPMSIT